MKRIKVLTVDDSSIVRRLIKDIVSSDPTLEWVGAASNGQEGVDKYRSLRPHVIILDQEMPVMTGIKTLEAIRKDDPFTAILMFSTLSEQGARLTLDALSAGANDFMLKPSQMKNFDEAMQKLKTVMLCKIHELGHMAVRPTPSPAKVRTSPTKLPPAVFSLKQDIDVVVIGCSTGGPEALAKVLPLLEAQFPVPILVVQHMPPLFTQMLAARLDRQSGIEVREAKDGEAIHAGSAWIAPGDFHMQVKRVDGQVVIALNQETPQNFCRPSVDCLFESAHEVYGGRALAVIMTGMGHDGLRGCQLLHKDKAAIVIQDQESSVVWSMPGAVERAGLADRVVPVQGIAREISRLVKTRVTKRKVSVDA